VAHERYLNQKEAAVPGHDPPPCTHQARKLPEASKRRYPAHAPKRGGLVVSDPYALTPSPAPIRLDLSRHCIQTEIKRQYERSLAACLRSGGEDDALAATVETLRSALETLDFPKLRAAHPALAGGRSDRVELVPAAGGRLTLLIDGDPFPLILRPQAGR
jgi:hypothetical protein